MEYIKQDVTNVTAGIVAHGVNCQHAMNSGVAKAIRAKWPIVYDKYMLAPSGRTMLGSAQLVEIEGFNDLYVVNCYTQVFYGYGGGKYADKDAIHRALYQVFFWAYQLGLPIYMPRIGCGLGGLSWEKDVEPTVRFHEESFPGVKVYICDLEENKDEAVSAK